MTRLWTPYQQVDNGNGTTSTRLTVKRACNGCGTLLGDTTDVEMNAAVRGQELRAVDHECGLCRGFHVLFADPDRRPIGWQDGDPDTWTVKVLCPGVPAGQKVLPCASWLPCGCVPPGDDPLTVEFQEFLDRPCPGSPTEEHRYLEKTGTVGAPTGGCWFQAAEVPAMDMFPRPGMWPVNVDADGDRPVYLPVDLSRRDTAPAVV